VLKPVKEFIEPYVYDVAAYSKLWEEHLGHIMRLFLVQMRKHNLTLNLKSVSLESQKLNLLDTLWGQDIRKWILIK